MFVATQKQIDDRENAALESWLAERKLDDLLLDQLESRFELTTNSQAREELAKRLATLYGQKLLALDKDSQQLLKRTRELISLYPRFETGRLRVAMLHARYLDSEQSFLDWIRTGSKFEAKEELESSLETLFGDLSNALSALMRRSEELFAAGQLNRDRRPLDAERKEVEAEAMHCQFLTGWSSYFLAMLRENQRAELLEQSESRFREFLQLDQQTVLSDYDSRWFDFSSAWHVRAISGLAAIALARGQESQANSLYSLIESNAVSQESRESVIRFRFLGHCYCGQFKEAANVVRNRKAISAMSKSGKVRLWATVVDASRAAPNSAELKQIALLGLTREMAGDRLVVEFEKDPAGEKADSFESNWIAGYVQFWKAENGKATSTENAKQFLEKAIAVGATQQPAVDPSDIARCRYLLAWLKLKANDTEAAVGMFSEVAKILATEDPQLASESAWLAAKTNIRLGNRNPGGANDAWNALERFIRSWPDSPHVASASFEKLKIELRSMRPEDAIERLKRISPNDENHASALLETAAQRYRIWQNQTGSETSLNGLKNACGEVDSSSSSTAGQKVRANFLLIDALSRLATPDLAQIDALIQRSTSLLSQIEDDKMVRAELLYYQMRLGPQTADGTVASGIAEELVEVGKGTRFELPALIQLAQHRDAKLSETKTDPNELALAIDIYRRLSSLLGQDEEKLKSSANARVAFARLGELQQLADQSLESERTFQTLVDIFPGNAKYLRNLAVAKSDSRSAKEIWQRLASGSDAGSELWFESKFELAKILASSDRQSAIQILKQTMQLGGEIPEPWRQAYESLLDDLSRGEDQ
jgi:hypothetical protein